jgi:hypothetical protein
MSSDLLSVLAQVIGTLGVIVSLVFVGLQIRQNTGALQRNEHNSTMPQWTVIRMAIAGNRDLAELMSGTFEATAGPLLATVLRTPRGGTWWNRARLAGFIPAYVADVDAVLAASVRAA